MKIKSLASVTAALMLVAGAAAVSIPAHAALPSYSAKPLGTQPSYGADRTLFGGGKDSNTKGNATSKGGNKGNSSSSSESGSKGNAEGGSKAGRK